MSIENNSGPDFLADKYNLHKQPEVDKSVERLRDQGGKVPETKQGRIDAHFSRIERALEAKRGLFTHEVKDKLLKDYTINLQNEDGTENTERVGQLVQGLFESEKEILRRRGMGEELEQYGETPTPEDFEKYRSQIYNKKQEQEKTLGNWIDYLGSKEADYYPVWFKYLALRSLQKMGKRDRDTDTYSKRSANTLQSFPDLSRESLGLTLTAVKDQAELGTTLDLEKSDEMTDEELKAQAEIDRLADKGDFAKLYAHFQGKLERERREKGESTAGEWIYYPKGSDARGLCKTLEGKGTEWCTAGYDVARGQLQSGEFYIYYTYDPKQKPTDPRVAIYLINGEISEVRGVYGKDQDLELDFVDIAREKYKDFPGSEKYEKKDRDMKQLTAIERKNKTGEELNKDDLIFLYEINSKIEGFGHGDDPRVAEIRATRDPKADAPTVLECEPQQIAWSQSEINENTKAYIGPLYPGIFNQLSNLEHIYTSFPEGKIRQSELEIGGKTAEQLENELIEKKININDYAKDMLHSPDFKVLPNKENIDLVRLKVADLGFSNGATTDEIYARASELGLDLCPPEVGPYQRLKDVDQQLYDYYRIAMKQIPGRRGSPRVFYLEHDDDGLWLYDSWTNPDIHWTSDYGLVFRLRQVSLET